MKDFKAGIKEGKKFLIKSELKKKLPVFFLIFCMAMVATSFASWFGFIGIKLAGGKLPWEQK